MYCHFGPCRTQSGGGKTFWNTADTFWIIFQQAYPQITFLAAISRFLDPLFLLPMYCHSVQCQRQSRGGKTFWNTVDTFWIIFHQAYLQITFPATISLFFGQLFFDADLLTFWVVPKTIPAWGNFRNHCWCILDDFPANISVKYISGNNFTVYSAVVFVANV